MKRRIILSAILYCSFILNHSAYSNSNLSIHKSSQFVLGLDVGVAETNQLGHRITFPLGYSTFSYVPNHQDSYFPRYGISLSRKFFLNHLNNILIGLSYHQIGTMNVTGELQQGISPPFYTANYQYAIHASQLLAEAKLQHQWRQVFYPYLTAGIGGGFNRAKNFSTTVPEYLTITPYFVNHSNSSFSYTVGLGIDSLLSPQMAVGLGYVFADFGKVGLGNGSIRGTGLSNYLNQSHLYVNTILVQLSCYI